MIIIPIYPIEKTIANKLEIYYNKNDLKEFQKTMDKVIQEAIYQNETEKVTELIKEKFLKNSYQNPLLLEYLGDCLFTLNQIELSTETYKKTLSQINFNNPINLPIISRIYFKSAKNSLLLGDVDNYLNNLNKSYIYEPKIDNKVNIKLQIIQDQINYNRINENQIKEDIKEILNNIKNISTENQEKVYINLAEIYNIANLQEEKIKLIKNIISKYKSKEALILQLQTTEDKKEKIKILEKLLESETEPYYMEQLGYLYLDENEKDKAIKIFQKVIEIIPTKHYILFLLASLYLEEKNYNLAKKYIDLALKLNIDPQYLELAGDIYYHIDPEKSIQYYEESISLYQDIQSKAKVRRKIVDIKSSKK